MNSYFRFIITHGVFYIRGGRGAFIIDKNTSIFIQFVCVCFRVPSEDTSRAAGHQRSPHGDPGSYFPAQGRSTSMCDADGDRLDLIETSRDPTRPPTNGPRWRRHVCWYCRWDQSTWFRVLYCRVIEVKIKEIYYFTLNRKDTSVF